MIKTMSRHSMSCSFRKTPGRPRNMRVPVGTLPALRGGLFCVAGLLGLATFCHASEVGSTPIDTGFDDQQILVTLPETSLTTTALPKDPDQLADIIQGQIQKARSTGDPRFLGYAEGLLNQWQQPLNDRLQVLKASVAQSNHRFDDARRELRAVINSGSSRQQRLQAHLMLANMSLVQGRYEEAEKQCGLFAQQLPGLIAASCQAQVLARTGQPEKAYKQLAKQVSVASTNDTSGLLWAQGTLGDLAAQLGKPAAENHWLEVLRLNPNDLYVRAQLADWYLQHQALDKTLALTEEYEDVESLAVIRSIAMKQSDHPDYETLAQRLEQRFAEARWRGNLLHQRDFARFQLDVLNNPELALSSARDNWTDQREPADTRLLLRAALAAGESRQVDTVRDWLAEQNQQDNRYPEAGQ